MMNILLLILFQYLAFNNHHQASALSIYRSRSKSNINVPSKSIGCTTMQHKTHHVLFGEKYGRGAEIYPVTNEIDFKLTDSFSNGVLPPSVQSIIDDNDNKKVDGTQGESPDEEQPQEKRQQSKLSFNNAINTILKSAARSQQTSKSPLIDQTPLNKRPPSIALFLMALGLIAPHHILSVIFISAYLFGLGFIASSPKSLDNNIPNMRSVPPQGHVPALISNPLGSSISNNPNYAIWLRFGVVFGYFAPLLYIFQTILDGQQYVSEVIASNLFLLSCQITTEDVCRKVLTPLPIRILIPLIYNSLRLGPLYDWVVMCWSGSEMSLLGKVLAVGNFVYWGVNLFLFLIPVATMKYMRAYFYAVEAEEVMVRDGDEENIGLMGR